MFKYIYVLLICCICSASTVNAGVVSKVSKGYTVYKIGKNVSPLVRSKLTKKVLKSGTKDSTKPLVKNELKVGEYGKLKQSPSKELQYHHIPSTKQIEKFGIKKDNGIAIGMQSTRHSLTRTYKNGNKQILKNNETPRDALARDIKDTKRIYEDNGHYSPEVRKSLQETIAQNKSKFPELYKK